MNNNNNCVVEPASSKDDEKNNNLNKIKETEGLDKCCDINLGENDDLSETFSNKTLIDDGDKWRRATHLGICKKCKKRAYKGGYEPQRRELDDDELCQEHYKKKRIFTLILVLISLSIVLLFFLALSSKWADSNAQKGAYPGKTKEQIEADLNAQVLEGEMNVAIMNTVKFPNGTEDWGIANIENIEANHVDQKVTLRLKDNNEILYESGAIAPGEFIDKIKINKHLEPGAYKAIATFIGYEHTADFFGNHIQKGSPLAAEINLYVE